MVLIELEVIVEHSFDAIDLDEFISLVNSAKRMGLSVFEIKSLSENVFFN